MELLLIRHALPLRVEEVDGPADPPLADAGHQQARLLAGYLADEQLHAIYASPMVRAVETARPLAEAQGLDLVLEEGVAEYDRHSSWYVPVEELKASGDPRWHDMLAGKWEGDVDPAEFQRIATEAVDRIVDANPSRKVAIVCHGGVINAYVSKVLDLADPTGFFYPNYTSIHRIAAARSGERTILTLNETAHLRNAGLPIGLF